MTPEQTERFRRIIRRQVGKLFLEDGVLSEISPWGLLQTAFNFPKSVDNTAKVLERQTLLQLPDEARSTIAQMVDALAVCNAGLLHRLCSGWPVPQANALSPLWAAWYTAIPHVAHPDEFVLFLPILQRRQHIAFAPVEGEPWWWEQLAEEIENAEHRSYIAIRLMSLRPLQNKEITLAHIDSIPQDLLRALRGHAHLLTREARDYLVQRVKVTLFQSQEFNRQALILLRELASPALVEIADQFLEHCEDYEVESWRREAYILFSKTWKTL